MHPYSKYTVSVRCRHSLNRHRFVKSQHLSTLDSMQVSIFHEIDFSASDSYFVMFFERYHANKNNIQRML